MHDVELPHPSNDRSLVGRLVSASAMLVALSSLGIALYEARMTREHDKLSVWPYVGTYHTMTDSGTSFEVQNVGIGPAVVRSFQLRVDGKRRRDWGDVLGALGVPSLEGVPNYYSSFGRGTVILPGKQIRLFYIGAGNAARVFHREAGPRMVARVCYCSLYQDCWVVEDSASTEPREVRACADDPASEFAH
jgi:hypothetical protein